MKQELSIKEFSELSGVKESRIYYDLHKKVIRGEKKPLEDGTGEKWFIPVSELSHYKKNEENNDSEIRSEEHNEDDVDMKIRKNVTERIIKMIAYDKISEHIDSCINENSDISEAYLLGIFNMTEELIDGIDYFLKIWKKKL